MTFERIRTLIPFVEELTPHHESSIYLGTKPPSRSAITPAEYEPRIVELKRGLAEYMTKAVYESLDISDERETWALRLRKAYSQSLASADPTKS